MHLIVDLDEPLPEPMADAQGAALKAAWAPLLQALQPAWRLPGTPDTLHTPRERARARLLLDRDPRREEDGRLPFVAWARGAPGAWARLTPCHGLVGSDRITGLAPRELGLADAESRALFDAVEPLFSSEGVGLVWHSALHWHVQHDSLRGLPCASLDRMVGDSMQRWQGLTPLAAARLLRRLQNEAQMVLHEHPVNQARQARGALAVNSLWLSDAGAIDQVADAPAAEQIRRRLQDPQWAPELGPDAVDQISAWLEGQASPHDDAPPPGWLVLCGRAHAQAFAPRAPQPQGSSWWSRLRRWGSGSPGAAAHPVPSLEAWMRELNGLDDQEALS